MRSTGCRCVSSRARSTARSPRRVTRPAPLTPGATATAEAQLAGPLAVYGNRYRRDDDVAFFLINRDPIACELTSLKCELVAARQSIVLSSPGQDRLKRSDDGRVELRFHRLCQSQSRNPTRHSFTVRAIRGHCVVRVGNRNDSSQQGDFGVWLAVRVAVSVDPLVMV